jgi:hypothetical protein
MSAPPTLSPEDRLRQALGAVERPLVREWSVKSSGGHLVPGRWLASVPRPALGPAPARRLRETLRELAAPLLGVGALEAVQAAAVWVHFGHEPGPAGAVLKCYLEFPPAARPEPDLVYLALKWRGDGRWALSTYLDRKALGAADRKALLHDIVPPGATRDAMEALMDEASPADQSFLEVTEPATARRSLDLNLSALRCTLADRAGPLAAFLAAGDGGIAYLSAHGADGLGHVAAGTGRDGHPFATLYHGAHRVHGPL